MKLYKKYISVILCALIFCSVFTLSGCGNDNAYILTVELDSKPQNLDPQLSSTQPQKIAVGGLFEGLVRIDSSGNIVPAAAEEYKVTNNNLTYTFNLRKDAKWSNGDDVTAADFVFGFERALSPSTKSPMASELFCIKNAEAYNNGKAVSLGVAAEDDYTLTVTLEKPNDNFLKILTAPVAMPCNKKAFEKAQGKYGMDGENVVSNGSFSLRLWETEGDFLLRLNRNKKYTGKFKPQTAAVIFSMGDAASRAKKIESSNLSMGFVEVSDNIQNCNIYTFERTVYALVINKSGKFSSLDSRKAIAASIDRDSIKSDLPKSFTTCNTIVPNVVTADNEPVSKKLNLTVSESFDPDAARKSFALANKFKGYKMPTLNLIYYGGEAITKMAASVANSIQKSLGVVVNIVNKNDETMFKEAIKSGDYNLAIAPITTPGSTPGEFIGTFSSLSANNCFGYKNKSVDSFVSSLPSMTEKQVLNSLPSVVNTIMSDCSLIPICFYSEAFAYEKSLTCSNISPFGNVVDFALVRKSSSF